MSRPLRWLSISAITALVLAACGPAVPAATAEPTPATAGASCKERGALGIKEVLAVVDNSLACTTDADCTVTSVGSVCFDVCSRSVAVKALPAVNDAITKVDTTTCATFKQDGCRFDVPPCVLPSAARCVQGKCS
jgi:hypothetical protein